MFLLSSADFFSKLTFQKILSGTLSESQTVWIQIRTDILSLGLSCSGLKLFAKVISRQQKLPLERKEFIQ